MVEHLSEVIVAAERSVREILVSAKLHVEAVRTRFRLRTHF